MDKEKNKIYEILIADDNPENLKLLSEVLKKEGYKIRIATNGKQVLESIKISEPDILLLDVHMPEMDGFEVCKQLKKKGSKYINLPVIFLSALTDTFNKLQAFKSGGADYITKPYEIEEVKVRINTHIKVKYYILEIENLKKQLKEKNDEIKKLKNK